MKKIIVCVFCFVFCAIASCVADANQVESNISIEKNSKENKRYGSALSFDTNKKTNDLIKLDKVSSMNLQLFNNKLSKDNLEYQKYKTQLSEQQYQIYVILDKLLRASNLQYQNWRTGVNIDSKIVNASLGMDNLLPINGFVLENLYNNDDVLAFVIAHELAHLLLGHNQIALENNSRIQEIEKQIQIITQSSSNLQQDEETNSNDKNRYSEMRDDVTNLAYQTSVTSMNILMDRIYKQERKLELAADVEALTLMTRAGFDPNKAKGALVFLSNSPNVYTKRTTHPDIKTRQLNISEDLALLDVENIKNQGRKNLYNSNPISIKKSNDKAIIILEKSKNYSQYNYVADSKEIKFLKKGYSCYLKNDFDTAKRYFLNAYSLNNKNYIAPLYLSYIEEYNFKISKYQKALKKAKYWSKKAYSINPNDKYVIQQKEDIAEIYKLIKESGKNNKPEK